MDFFQLAKQQPRLDSDPEGGRLLLVAGLHQLTEVVERGQVPLLLSFVSRILRDRKKSRRTQIEEGGFHRRAQAIKGNL